MLSTVATGSFSHTEIHRNQHTVEYFRAVTKFGFESVLDFDIRPSKLLRTCTIPQTVLLRISRVFFLQTIETYSKIIPSILSASCLQRPLIILIDGIDQVKSYSSRGIEWIPSTLPDNIKLILAVTEDTQMHKDLANCLDASNFIKMPLLGENEAKGILMSSVMQYNHSVNSKIQDCVLKSVQECTLPLYAKVLAWQTSWWADKEHDIVPKGHIKNQLMQMLEELEHILGAAKVQHALALMNCTKHGITDSEMIDLLAFDPEFHSSATYGKNCYCKD